MLMVQAPPEPNRNLNLNLNLKLIISPSLTLTLTAFPFLSPDQPYNHTTIGIQACPAVEVNEEAAGPNRKDRL